MEVMNQISAFLKMLADHPILSTLGALGLLDLLLRRKETQKAVSVLIGIQAIAQGLDKLIGKLIPQKLAAPTAQDSEGK